MVVGTRATGPQRGLVAPWGMTAEDLHLHVIDPALWWLNQYAVPPSGAVRRLLAAIAAQEGDARHRAQVPSGPARGLWQMEPGTLAAVVGHPETRTIMGDWVLRTGRRGVSPQDLVQQLRYDDVFACIAARCLLLCDPHPIPHDADGAWSAYLRVWRPGRPRPERWPASWAYAVSGLDEMHGHPRVEM